MNATHNATVGSAASTSIFVVLTLTLSACTASPTAPPPPEVIVLPAECTCSAPGPTHSALAAFGKEYQALAGQIIGRVTSKDVTSADIEKIRDADLNVRSAIHALAAQGRKPQAETIAQTKQALDTLREALDSP